MGSKLLVHHHEDDLAEGEEGFYQHGDVYVRWREAVLNGTIHAKYLHWSMSLENLLRIRPEGVTSKNAMGDIMMELSMSPWT